jgi:NAD(P)H-hydrate epimerase
MQNVITVKNMRESDAHTIQAYVPSRELMYRAALGVYRAAKWQGNIAILAGGGNNGGDGYALACILADNGIPSKVYRVGSAFSPDGQYYHDLAQGKGVEIVAYGEDDTFAGYDILVDCMLGTGFSGVPRGLFRPAIQAVNQSGAYVISVDINSGMNGDTGRGSIAVRSARTVTIGYLKSGFFLGDAPDLVGDLVVADIGIRLIGENYYLASPDEVVFPNSGLSLDGDRVELLTPGEVAACIPEGGTLLTTAEELALERREIVRVLGRHPLVTDGHRTYFLAEGALPKVIQVEDT